MQLRRKLPEVSLPRLLTRGNRHFRIDDVRSFVRRLTCSYMNEMLSKKHLNLVDLVMYTNVKFKFRYLPHANTN